MFSTSAPFFPPLPVQTKTVSSDASSQLLEQTRFPYQFPLQEVEARDLVFNLILGRELPLVSKSFKVREVIQHLYDKVKESDPESLLYLVGSSVIHLYNGESYSDFDFRIKVSDQKYFELKSTLLKELKIYCGVSCSKETRTLHSCEVNGNLWTTFSFIDQTGFKVDLLLEAQNSCEALFTVDRAALRFDTRLDDHSGNIIVCSDVSEDDLKDHINRKDLVPYTQNWNHYFNSSKLGLIRFLVKIARGYQDTFSLRLGFWTKSLEEYNFFKEEKNIQSFKSMLTKQVERHFEKNDYKGRSIFVWNLAFLIDQSNIHLNVKNCLFEHLFKIWDKKDKTSTDFSPEFFFRVMLSYKDESLLVEFAEKSQVPNTLEEFWSYVCDYVQRNHYYGKCADKYKARQGWNYFKRQCTAELQTFCQISTEKIKHYSEQADPAMAIALWPALFNQSEIPVSGRKVIFSYLSFLTMQVSVVDAVSQTKFLCQKWNSLCLTYKQQKIYSESVSSLAKKLEDREDAMAYEIALSKAFVAFCKDVAESEDVEEVSALLTHLRKVDPMRYFFKEKHAQKAFTGLIKAQSKHLHYLEAAVDHYLALNEKGCINNKIKKILSKQIVNKCEKLKDSIEVYRFFNHPEIQRFFEQDLSTKQQCLKIVGDSISRNFNANWLWDDSDSSLDQLTSILDDPLCKGYLPSAGPLDQERLMREYLKKQPEEEVTRATSLRFRVIVGEKPYFTWLRESIAKHLSEPQVVTATPQLMNLASHLNQPEQGKFLMQWVSELLTQRQFKNLEQPLLKLFEAHPTCVDKLIALFEKAGELSLLRGYVKSSRVSGREALLEKIDRGMPSHRKVLDYLLGTSKRGAKEKAKIRECILPFKEEPTIGLFLNELNSSGSYQPALAQEVSLVIDLAMEEFKGNRYDFLDKLLSYFEHPTQKQFIRSASAPLRSYWEALGKISTGLNKSQVQRLYKIYLESISLAKKAKNKSELSVLQESFARFLVTHGMKLEIKHLEEIQKSLSCFSKLTSDLEVQFLEKIDLRFLRILRPWFSMQSQDQINDRLQKKLFFKMRQQPNKALESHADYFGKTFTLSDERKEDLISTLEKLLNKGVSLDFCWQQYQQSAWSLPLAIRFYSTLLSAVGKIRPSLDLVLNVLNEENLNDVFAQLPNDIKEEFNKFLEEIDNSSKGLLAISTLSYPWIKEGAELDPLLKSILLRKEFLALIKAERHWDAKSYWQEKLSLEMKSGSNVYALILVTQKKRDLEPEYFSELLPSVNIHMFHNQDLEGLLQSLLVNLMPSKKKEAYCKILDDEVTPAVFGIPERYSSEDCEVIHIFFNKYMHTLTNYSELCCWHSALQILKLVSKHCPKMVATVDTHSFMNVLLTKLPNLPLTTKEKRALSLEFMQLMFDAGPDLMILVLHTYFTYINRPKEIALNLAVLHDLLQVKSISCKDSHLGFYEVMIKSTMAVLLREEEEVVREVSKEYYGELLAFFIHSEIQIASNSKSREFSRIHLGTRYLPFETNLTLVNPSDLLVKTVEAHKDYNRLKNNFADCLAMVLMRISDDRERSHRVMFQLLKVLYDEHSTLKLPEIPLKILLDCEKKKILSRSNELTSVDEKRNYFIQLLKDLRDLFFVKSSNLCLTQASVCFELFSAIGRPFESHFKPDEYGEEINELIGFFGEEVKKFNEEFNIT